MKIKHFGGTEYANNISEFSEILQKKGMAMMSTSFGSLMILKIILA